MIKKCFFGKVVDDKIKLNVVDKIAQKSLKDIPKYYNGVSIDEFIIMPNHIHLILELVNIVVTQHCSVTAKNNKNYG